MPASWYEKVIREFPQGAYDTITSCKQMIGLLDRWCSVLIEVRGVAGLMTTEIEEPDMGSW